MAKKKKELCIMPTAPYKQFKFEEEETPMYFIERFQGSERHEVFGAANRKKSIEDGLIVYLTPRHHRDNNFGIHADAKYRLEVQRIAQRTWMEHYNKTEDDMRS